MKLASKAFKRNFKTTLGPRADFYIFAFFVATIFFTAGGSRDDIQSLVFVRPLAILLCAFAITRKTIENWRDRTAPLYFALALLLIMVLQLIPLPPGIWTKLPEREIFADIANIAAIDQPWRPLTLSPSKTLNSLFALIVPIAAVMLFLNLDREYRRRVIPLFLILCSVSAIWAIFQLVGPDRGPLYLYRITNFGSGVGLFANRNHQAVLLASTIVMYSWYAASLNPSVKLSVLKYYGSIAAIFVLIPLIFVTGSRAGLLLMAPALMFALFFLYFGRYTAISSSKNKSSRKSSKFPITQRQIILIVGAILMIGTTISSIAMSQSVAYDRLFGGRELGELRVQLIPTLLEMVRDFYLFGSGFGSFEHIYKIYEPYDLLRPNYLNQAHNDWLQFAIEGGLPAILLFLGSLFWVMKKLISLVQKWNSSGSAKYKAVMSLTVIVFCLAASLVDYPLRVPSVMVIFCVMICIFNDSLISVQRSYMKSR